MKLAKSLLSALAMIFLVACNTTTTNKPAAAPSKALADNEERIIIIPPLKDPTSVHNARLIRHATRHEMGNWLNAGFEDSERPLLTGEHILEATSDTTKLHIKGDSCWLEYVSAGILHSKKKDGSYLHNPGMANEITDTVRIR